MSKKLSAFTAGNISKWQGPIDSQGRICGFDLDVYDRRYLMRYNKDTCKEHECLVCVEKCPDFDFYYTSYDAIVPRLLGSTTTMTPMTDTTTLTSNETTSEATTSTNEVTTSSLGTESTIASSTVMSDFKIEATTARSHRQVRHASNEPIPKKNVTFTELQNIIKGYCRPDVKINDEITFEQLDYLVNEKMCPMQFYKSDENQEGRLCNSVVNETERNGWRHTLPKISRDIRNTK